jgi:murein DD-endopeptidase MepM/ murein hydrolase activator NlpD
MVPEVPDTVPPREPPAGTGAAAVGPQPGQVVTVDLRAARASALAREALLEQAIAQHGQLEQTLKSLQDRVGALAAAAGKAVRDLARARLELRDRAVDAYVRGRTFDTAPLDVNQAGPEAQRSALLTVVVDRDRAAVQRVKELQAKVTADQAKVAKELTDTQSKVEQAKVDEAQALLDLGYAKLDLAVSNAGGNIVIHGFVFPVADPHTFREDFGDPRQPDTPLAHPHQGCDIVATQGTELYAAERGVITQLSEGGLGGTTLWLKGESGTAYYYAHLFAYAPRLHPGQLVEGGDLVGYVGQTGDATGPHLHFEVHPGGGAAVDPYPILLAVDKLRRSP